MKPSSRKGLLAPTLVAAGAGTLIMAATAALLAVPEGTGRAVLEAPTLGTPTLAAPTVNGVGTPFSEATGPSLAGPRRLTVAGMGAPALGTTRPPVLGTMGPQPAAAAASLEECPLFDIMRPEPDPYRSFYFTRGAYSSDPFGFRGGSWAVDFPKADRQFMIVMERLLNIDAFPCENPVRLDDPHLRRFPFLYMVEVGYMGLTPPEVEGLREYLLSGGFLMVDDFWGTREWYNFESEISRVLPEYPIVEVPMDHLIFRIVYPIREILTVPSVNRARSGLPYYEQDGVTPHVRGIFDDEGRLMVLISWNSDLGDAWEWAEQPDYPWDRSNYAFQLGFNVIVYAMTH